MIRELLEALMPPVVAVPLLEWEVDTAPYVALWRTEFRAQLGPATLRALMVCATYLAILVVLWRLNGVPVPLNWQPMTWTLAGAPALSILLWLTSRKRNEVERYRVTADEIEIHRSKGVLRCRFQRAAAYVEQPDSVGGYAVFWLLSLRKESRRVLVPANSAPAFRLLLRGRLFELPWRDGAMGDGVRGPLGLPRTAGRLLWPVFFLGAVTVAWLLAAHPEWARGNLTFLIALLSPPVLLVAFAARNYVVRSYVTLALALNIGILFWFVMMTYFIVFSLGDLNPLV